MRRLHPVEEGAGQVGPPPLPAAGVLVEAPERLPVRGLERVAGQRDDVAAEGLGAGALLADRLALARREIAEEGLEIRIAAVHPVELLGRARKEPDRLAPVPLLRRAERDVQARDPRLLGERQRALQQRGASLGLEARPGQEAPAGGRGEGNRGLQLRVVAPAGALPGMRPVVIEDVLALAVRPWHRAA